jgi:hypothetical protein
MTKEISEGKISGSSYEFESSMIWSIVRILSYLLTFVTIIFFWWSWIGIATGLLLYLKTKNAFWKRNWLALVYIIALTTLLVELFSPYYLILGILLFGVYITATLFIFVWDLIPRKTRKASGTIGEKLSKWAKKIPEKVRIEAKFAIFIIPILMWSVVSLDFGVMFDNNPQLIWVHGPSSVNNGDQFTINVQAWDRYERLSAHYKGTVVFDLVSYNLATYEPINSTEASLPSTYTFTGQPFSQGFIPGYQIADGKDNGKHAFTVRINTTGIHYLLVNDSVTGNTYWSNPILVKNYTDNGRKLYWGDLHSHSILSDGSGTPEHSFDYGRHVALLDFHALSDHGEDLSLFGISNMFFGVVESAANQKYDPGNYVTFQALEWTPHYPPSYAIDYGHYTCIFSGDQLPIVASNYQKSPNALWDFLDDFTNSTGARALAIPHHTIRYQFIQDWTYLNPKYVKLAEVTSVHGECLYGGHDPLNYRGSVDTSPEYVNGAAIIDAFKMGYRMTMCANGDNHDGHPGHSISHTAAYIGHQWPFTLDHPRNGHPYPSGLTAAYAGNLTREGIFEALENTRTFANSDHGRPLINFTINGVSVGEGSTVYVATNTTQRNIGVFLAQDGAPASTKHNAASVTPNWVPDWNITVEIIKNGVILNSFARSSPVFQLDLTDSSTITGTSYNESIQMDGQWYINEFSDQAVDPVTLNTSGADFYILRVVGANGRTSYAGPIWVEVL